MVRVYCIPQYDFNTSLILPFELLACLVFFMILMPSAEFCFSESSIDTVLQMFKTRLNGQMNTHIPTKTLKGRIKRKPWIDKKMKTAMQKKARLYTRMKKTRKEPDIRRY